MSGGPSKNSLFCVLDKGGEFLLRPAATVVPTQFWFWFWFFFSSDEFQRVGKVQDVEYILDGDLFISYFPFGVGVISISISIDQSTILIPDPVGPSCGINTQQFPLHQPLPDRSLKRINCVRRPEIRTLICHDGGETLEELEDWWRGVCGEWGIAFRETE